MIHFNRPTLLTKTLPSYLAFKNIFVWDNNSTKENKIFLRAFSMKNKNVVPFWHNKNVGWPRAINTMAAVSNTDWILITAEDMLLGKDFLQKANNLLKWKPNLEQIYLSTFDSMLFHKKTFARFGWFEERQNPVSPTAEDDDWYLRLVEFLGFSPYVFPGEHVKGAERERRLKFASTRNVMERMDNISYFSNCRWGISSINFDVKEITRDKTYIKQFVKNEGESGLVFHHKKWERTGDESDLLNKDGTFWKRKMKDEDFYPDVRERWANNYGVKL
jgi:hypothetical protein